MTKSSVQWTFLDRDKQRDAYYEKTFNKEVFDKRSNASIENLNISAVETNALEHFRQIHLVVISGVHGDESNAVRLVNTLKNIYTEKFIKDNGWENVKITFIEEVNISGLESNERGYVFKQRENDFNRAFGEEEQSPDDVVQQIKDVILDDIKNCYVTYVIDVHNSPFCKDQVLLDFGQKNSQLVKGVFKPNDIFYTKWASTSGTIKDFANQTKGCYGMTVELGGMSHTTSDKYNEQLDFLERLINSLIKETKEEENTMLGYSSTVSNRRTLIDDTDGMIVSVKSKRSGMVVLSNGFDIDTVFKHHYNKGEMVCEIRACGDDGSLDYLYAPDNGYVTDFAWSAYIGRNEEVFSFVANNDFSVSEDKLSYDRGNSYICKVPFSNDDIYNIKESLKTEFGDLGGFAMVEDLERDGRFRAIGDIYETANNGFDLRLPRLFTSNKFGELSDLLAENGYTGRRVLFSRDMGLPTQNWYVGNNVF